MKYRYWGPFRQVWYSICSAHRENDANCPRCRTGFWSNALIDWCDAQVFAWMPRVWSWWHNRKVIAARKEVEKQLKKEFPSLHEPEDTSDETKP